jgi:hypothetical protein
MLWNKSIQPTFGPNKLHRCIAYSGCSEILRDSMQANSPDATLGVERPVHVLTGDVPL